MAQTPSVTQGSLTHSPPSFCLQLWEESQKQNSRLREDNDRMRDDLSHATRQLDKSKVSKYKNAIIKHNNTVSKENKDQKEEVWSSLYMGTIF